MSSLRSVTVGQLARDRIHALLRNADAKDYEPLFDELDAATVVPDHLVPDDVVCMHSTITFIDLDTALASTVHLVYPHEVGNTAGNISILAPVGAALIGLRVGETIDWPLPNKRRRRLRVVAVESSA